MAEWAARWLDIGGAMLNAHVVCDICPADVLLLDQLLLLRQEVVLLLWHQCAGCGRRNMDPATAFAVVVIFADAILLEGFFGMHSLVLLFGKRLAAVRILIRLIFGVVCTNQAP